MGKAFERKSTANTKDQVVPIKKDPKRELMNRLKLLDSIGKSNPISTLGSIRKGYVTITNVSMQANICL